MSPSWRERLQVELGAQALRVRRLSRGWRPRVLADEQGALVANTPEAAAVALSAALAPLALRGLRAEVMLSGDWVRLALQGDAAGLRGPAERQAAATHALRRVYGDEAARWQAAACDAGPGLLLAAGVDAALVERLRGTLQAAGAKLASVQPSFAQAVNRCRRWLGRPGWLLCLEPGLATLAWCDGQGLRTLRRHRLRRSLREELPVWIEQARLTEGHGEAESELTIACRGALPGDMAELSLATRVVALDGGEAR